MITLTQNDVAGMDGNKHILKHIRDAKPIAEDMGYVSDAIDVTLAAVEQFSEDRDDAIQHLDFIINELSRAKNNIRATCA